MQLLIHSSYFNRLLERIKQETWHGSAQPAVCFLPATPRDCSLRTHQGEKCPAAGSTGLLHRPGWKLEEALLFLAACRILSQHPGTVCLIFSSTPSWFWTDIFVCRSVRWGF